jgi:ferredoxin
MLKPMLFGGASKDDLPMESPLEAMLERTDRHLDNFSALVRPAPESRPRTSFTSKLPRRQISAFNLTLRQRLRVVPKAVPLLFNILRSARMYDGRFKATRSEASPEFIAELEVMARAAGARRTRVRAKNLRINTIYTNITNLPLHAGDEHEWVRDFCAMCKRCIRKCPPKAIYPEPRPRGEGSMQCIDHDTCRDYFSSNFGCAVCLAECPFSHVGYDKVKASFKGNKAAPRFHLRTIA